MSKENVTDVEIHSTIEELQAFFRDRIWSDMQAILEELKEGGVSDLRDPETPDDKLGYIRGGLAMIDEMLDIDETLIEFKSRQREEIKDE